MSRKALLFNFILILLLTPGLLPAQQLQNSYQQTVKTGIDLFERGLYAEAAQHFKRTIVESNDEAVTEMALFYHTRSLARLDSSGTGLYVDRFIKEYPLSDRSAYLLKDVAHQYKLRGDYSSAISRMDDALNYPQRRTERAELYYTLGETAADNQDYELARNYFLTLSDTYPRSEWSPRALYARGSLILKKRILNLQQKHLNY